MRPDDDLWYEIDHHQTRQELQHTGRNPILHQMNQELCRLGSVFYDAAIGAWENRNTHGSHRHTFDQLPQHQHNLPHQSNNTNDAYMRQFGIPDETTFLGKDEDCTSFDDHRKDFVFLPQFKMRPENGGHAFVANLDVYLQNLYSYFYHRGITPIICKGVVELVTLIITLLLSVFLLAYVDWRALAQCHDEGTCRDDFKNYIIQRPLRKLGIWRWAVIVYILLFCGYTVLRVLSFIEIVESAVSAQLVFENRLGISNQKLLGGAIDWNTDVVCKLIGSEYRISVTPLDALVITNRIMRKENYLIALFNRGLLDLRMPTIFDFITDTCYCPSLEWSLYFCILNFMFNHKYEIRPSFYLDPGSLRRRFQICGLAHLIFMPFLVFFVTMLFGLKNAYSWKSTKEYLGPREWSETAKWTFREFNELPHVFEKRLAPSYKSAERYLGLFGSNEYIAAMGRVLVFIGGSFGAVLFAFAAINDAILLHVKIANWNLLWYAGLFGILFSGGKALIPKPEAESKSSRNLYAEIDEALETVSSFTHFMPETWKKRGWDMRTYKAFSALYKYKAKLFASEVLSLIMAPYILCVSLANCSEAICEFVVATKAEINGAGEVCGYATFDFETFNDEGEARNDMVAGSLAESIMQTGSVCEATRRVPRPKARMGKMKNSLISFQTTHPNWHFNTARHEIQQFTEIRSNDALTREEEVYQEVATKQLETLERIEREQTVHDTVDGTRIQDSYIGSHQIPFRDRLASNTSKLSSVSRSGNNQILNENSFFGTTRNSG